MLAQGAEASLSIESFEKGFPNRRGQILAKAAVRYQSVRSFRQQSSTFLDRKDRIHNALNLAGCPCLCCVN